ncbi:ScyD/ScyE family protein [Nakamurella sp. YIM 132087]|uniref:ScyD/ScyE family protein n=1 Tax=Nakamurella alba TaxID=2665158 RepID=A0A7K1FIA5_9ACTN|nr:ScyD/ScyE family protein [Nakamurella alba]MTD13851.1 ScyD/ScyE family protein [Nakamurella alba]
MRCTRALSVAALPVVLAASVLAAGPAGAAPAPAAPSPISSFSAKTMAGGLFSPLSFAVAPNGDAYVSQNFIGVLTKVSAKGGQKVVAGAPMGDEIGAVSFRNNTVYYYQGSQPAGTALLMRMPVGGTPTPLGDLGAHEATANPDQGTTYGFVGLNQDCLDQVDPSGPAGPPVYQGIVDSHPYASVATAAGVYVADAGGNDIVKVAYDGTVTTVAVLPPAAPITITADLAAGAGFPDCTVGAQYRFEGVPTDVEVGPGGWLYVTSLPGGPEDPSLGARGTVVRVNPATGAVQTVATGLVGPTGLAVDAATGVMLVAELFGGPTGRGQVSALLPSSGSTPATPVGALPVSSPAAVEIAGGAVYVSKDAFVSDATGAPQKIGKLVRVSVSGAAAAFRPAA